MYCSILFCLSVLNIFLSIYPAAYLCLTSFTYLSIYLSSWMASTIFLITSKLHNSAIPFFWALLCIFLIIHYALSIIYLTTSCNYLSMYLSSWMASTIFLITSKLLNSAISFFWALLFIYPSTYKTLSIYLWGWIECFVLLITLKPIYCSILFCWAILNIFLFIYLSTYPINQL